MIELPLNSSQSPVVGRLAPSPTGGLHLGHARTFLIAWLIARRAGGRVILRIEDLDASRVRADAQASALVDLRWLGLDWDEGPDVGGPSAPYLQSERSALYDQALERLKASESVYPCTCTRADVEHAASAPHAADEGPTYPGTCAHRCAGDALALARRHQRFAWRLRVPAGLVAWDDLFLGHTGLDPSRLGGDFLVARDGTGHSYQLAVVVDDATMGVNQIIRGADLVPSTPRQILLLSPAGLAASHLRARPAGHHPGRPPPGQTRRLPQALSPPRRRPRLPLPHRLARPLLRLDPIHLADDPNRSDQTLRPTPTLRRSLGCYPRMAPLTKPPPAIRVLIPVLILILILILLLIFFLILIFILILLSSCFSQAPARVRRSARTPPVSKKGPSSRILLACLDLSVAPE